MRIILKVGWKQKLAGAFPVAPLYQEIDLPYVPRVGERVELWPGTWRDVKSVKVHRHDGAVFMKLDFGEEPAYARPEEAKVAIDAAKTDGWGEAWSPSLPPSVYVGGG